MMNEWIISSSVLIAAVLLGRRLLKGKISLRLQYALWAMVLLRLLIPFQIFTSDFGAGSIANEVDLSEPVRQVYFAANEEQYEIQYNSNYREMLQRYESKGEQIHPAEVEQQAAEYTRQTLQTNMKSELFMLWLRGMAVMAAVIISCNIHLALRLRRRRRALEVPGSLLPVYVTEAVPTPCVFGLFRPAIYLTPGATRDGQVRTHVLEHELTHYRHFDHVWSVLRTLCLVLHWYNPLVWIAAKVSRADAELACDEGALARLGESQRGDYGRTLIGLTCSAPISDLLITATTMTGSAGSIRERIKLLMQRPRNSALTVTAVILMVTLMVGCTFASVPETTPPTETTAPTGVDSDMSDQDEEPPSWTAPSTEAQLKAYYEELLNPQPDRSEADWYPRALTSFYETPAQIDLFQLFYAGIPGGDNSITHEEQAFLETCPGYEPEFDLVRISATEMDQVLQQYFGISLEQTDGIGLENFIYWEDGDCYYHSHTDTNLGFIELNKVEMFENGSLRITYTNESDQICVVTLVKSVNGWRIISNLEAEKPIPEDPAAAGLLNADGLLTYPGIQWFMTETEVLAALGLTRRDVLDAQYINDNGMNSSSVTINHSGAFGVPMVLDFTFRSYWENVEPVLTEVYGRFIHPGDFETVRSLYAQALGDTDVQITPGLEERWDSDILLRNLLGKDGYEVLDRCPPDSLNTPAAHVQWVDSDSPEIIWFTELPEPDDRIAEVTGLFSQYADPAYRAALLQLYDYADPEPEPFTLEELFLPEIVKVTLTTKDDAVVFYRRPGGSRLYAVQLYYAEEEGCWFVLRNRMVLQMEDYPEPRTLTETELQQFRNAFRSILPDGGGNPAACFLLPYYEDISQMDGGEFLAYFPTDQEGTKEEFELLKAKYPDFFADWTWETMPIPIHCYSAKEIDAVVSRYGNIHWVELSQGVHYLEETGCYYNYTSDFGLGGFYPRGGFVYDGGAVVYSDFSALFFTETAGSYTISAHMPALIAE